jgi:hypothetical protein
LASCWVIEDPPWRKTTAISVLRSQSSSAVYWNAEVASASMATSPQQPNVPASDSGSISNQRRQPAT